MSSIVLRVLSVVLYVTISACTTMRAVPDWRAGAPAGTPGENQGLNVDDEILVTTVSGNQLRLIVLNIEPNALLGYSHQHGYVDRKDQPIRVPFDEIATVERSEVSAWRTSLGITGAVLIVLAVMLGNALSMGGGG